LPLSDLGGAWRQPRLQVLANGAPVAGAVRAEVASNNYYAADRFLVEVALSADPATGAAFWSATSDIVIEVRMSLSEFGIGSWQSLIVGAVDLVDIDPVNRVATIEGRDLTALLIEARTQETFSNHTSSEIATILAGRHGLTANVTATTAPVGRYYQLEHDRTTLDQFSRATTEWDLLVFLAQQEGFDVFVSGTTLYFQPPTTATIPALTLVPFGTALAPANVTALTMERSLTLARDIEVTVKSWNSRQQNAFTQTARSSQAPPSRSGSLTPQQYVFVRPNLTTGEALQLAQTKLAELTRHELIITATMPGELALTPRDIVALAGTGTAFDQIYHVDEIERRLSTDEGFVQQVRAKNSSVGSQTTPPADIVASVTG